jgi:hypothetical protein
MSFGEHRRQVSARSFETGFGEENEYETTAETVPSGVSARITDAIRRRLTYASQRANVCYGIVAHRSRFKFWVGVNAVPIRGIRIETAPASWIGGRGLYPLVRMVSETPR